MRGVLDLHALTPHASPGEALLGARHGAQRAREHDRAWPIERREDEPLGVLHELLGERPLGERDREHPALAGDRVGEATLLGDDLHGVLEREDAGEVRGRGLAHAVAHERVRRDPPRAPQGRERDLHAEERDLHDVGVVQARAPFPGEQLVDDREAAPRLHLAVAGRQRGAERGLLDEQRAGHSQPLGAMTRTHEDEAWPLLDGREGAEVAREER